MKIEQNKKHSGQAITELLVCIIGILIVFSGFLMIVDLGVAKVENVIEARGEAERNSCFGIFTLSVYPIRTWTAGKDSMYFSEDDRRIIPTTEDITKFSGELKNPIFSLATDFSMPYVENNFAANLDSTMLFLPAARLTGGRSSTTITLDGATRALYFDTPSITVTDILFMPSLK